MFALHVEGDRRRSGDVTDGPKRDVRLKGDPAQRVGP